MTRFSQSASGISLAIAATILADALVPVPARAAWPTFGRAIAVETGEQGFPRLTGDGAGGAILTWLDRRDPALNVFAQRVRASGDVDPAWPAGGRLLLADPVALTDAAEGQGFPVIVPDGAGGAIVAWQDGRSALTGDDIFAQHVKSSGEVDGAWPANGTPLVVIAGLQRFPASVPDGTGGAIVTWMDGRPGASVFDVYAQRVLASGAVDPAWPANGLAVSTAPGPQQLPVIVEDGAGGAIIAWFEDRGEGSLLDIYAQRVLASGTVDPAWPANGRAVCAVAGDQYDVVITSDGAGGALLAWTDTRGDVTDIFTHHVRASGELDPNWPASGLQIADAALVEQFPEIVSDGVGGAIVVWEAIPFRQSLFAQHVQAQGVVDGSWPENGRNLAPTGNESQTNHAIASDGLRGVIVSWQDRFDIYAQRVLAAGELDPSYPVGGRELVTLPSQQQLPAIVATGERGAIVAWADLRNGDSDIFAMQVLEAGSVDAPGPVLTEVRFLRPSPNPAGAPVLLRFSLPGAATVDLAIYDVMGRPVRQLVSGSQPEGERAFVWDLQDERGHPVRPGLYFARLTVDGHAYSQKLVRSE